MTTTMPGGWVPGREHAALLARADLAERDEEAARRGRAEAFAFQCQTMAGQMYEQQAMMRAAADSEARRAELAAQRDREDRQVSAQNARAQLLASGRRPRTVAEILGDFAAFA